MWSVPQGVVLVLMRHGQTTRNLRVAKAREQNKGSDFPARFPEEDDQLTRDGMCESALAAKFLRNKMGSIDLLVYSSTKRTEQTAEFIMRGVGLGCSIMQIPELSEKFRWVPSEFSYAAPRNVNEFDIQTFRFVVEFLQDFVRSRGDELGPESIAKFSELLGDYLPTLFEWRKQQEEHRIALRNYSKFGEGFIDLLMRAIGVLLKIWNRIELGECRIVVVGHAKMLVMLRAILEDLNLEDLDRIYSAEGPPFPCNVGMTFYGEQKGKLVRLGEEVEIPDGLVLLPNRRQLRMATASIMERKSVMASVAEMQRSSRRRYGPPRRGNGIPSSIMDFLRKASPRASVPFQRRSGRK